jgi:hypothetical protein
MNIIDGYLHSFGPKTVNTLCITPGLGTIIGGLTIIENFGKSLASIIAITSNTLTNLSFAPCKDLQKYVVIHHKLKQTNSDRIETYSRFHKLRTLLKERNHLDDEQVKNYIENEKNFRQDLDLILWREELHKEDPLLAKCIDASDAIDAIERKLTALESKEERLKAKFMPKVSPPQPKTPVELAQLRERRENLNRKIDKLVKKMRVVNANIAQPGQNLKYKEMEKLYRQLLAEEANLWGELYQATHPTLSQKDEILRNQILKYRELAEDKYELCRSLQFIVIGLIRAIPIAGGIALSLYDSHQERVRDLRSHLTQKQQTNKQSF